MTTPPATPLRATPSNAYPRVLIGGLLAVAAAIALTWLVQTPPGLLGKADAIGYAVCHRIEARTFHVHDRPMPLCARCTGIYLGVMLGLGLIAARGQLRAGRLPAVRYLAGLLLFGGAIAVDGLNSYLTFFDFYTPLYQPTNTLRLFTGLYAGITMITLVWPVFVSTVLRAPLRAAPVERWRDLALWIGAATVLGLVILAELPAVLWVASLVSATGVLLMFVIVGAALFVSLLRREGAARRGRELAVPALAGLTFALAVVGAIDVLRYLLTGTWDGFNLPG